MPEQNPFDKASRALIREAGIAFLCWRTGLPRGAVKFVRPLEPKLSVPGWPEREGDVIWHVTREDRGGQPWAALIEVQCEPDAVMPGRLLVYPGLVWMREKPTPHPGDRYSLLPVVVNLTGVGTTGREMWWAEGKGMAVLPYEWNVGSDRAEAVLGEIARGEAPRMALPWIPLMQGGSEPDIIRRWLLLAEAEADAGRRALLTLVKVFAELAGCPGPWKRAMEGFIMRRSAVVDEWKAESKAEAVLDVLEARFGDLPADLVAKLAEVRPLEDLRRWTRIAARAESVAQFREQAGV